LSAPQARVKAPLVTQGAVQWAVGGPFLGIRPARPLKIVIFGCEDDGGDLHEIIRDARFHLKYTDEEAALAIANCLYYHHTETSGIEFLQMVERIMERDHADLVIINPMHAYVGGDVRDPAITGPWLRNTLMPILDRRNAAALIVHHPPKPINRQTEKWKEGSDWQYSAAGGADIVNAMRAILVLEPSGRYGTFRLIAAKRGKRLGWVDDNDHPQLERFISWDKHSIWWRPATDQEIREAKAKEPAATIEDVFDLVPKDTPIAKATLINQANERLEIGVNKARGFVTELIDTGRLFVHKVPRPRTNPAIFLAVYQPAGPEGTEVS
jgi:AAA domain